MEMNITDFIACLLEWRRVYGADVTVRINPNGKDILDCIDIVEIS